MTTDLTDKIKDEILLIQRRRHEFCMRKLAFAVGLLGVGAAGLKFNPNNLDLSLILYIAPLVAIAFDVHILAEDFRIKRAGQFIFEGLSNPTEEEKAWEKFVRDCRSPVVTLQYCTVTLIIIFGASLAICQREPKMWYFIPWFTITVISEGVLTGITWKLRRKLISRKRKV